MAAVADADVVLVPALAVGADGARLGRGGGSYDRALARVPAGRPRTALLYDGELLPGVPAEPHDQRVTGVVTPSGARHLVERGRMSTHELDVFLLVGAVVLLVSIAAVRLAVGSGLPTLLLYLGLGLVLGEDALGLDFNDNTLARSLGYAALVVILAEGGLTTPWESIRSVVPAAAALATIGTAVSVGVVGIAAHLLLDVGWQDALLIGAVLAPTDSAAVFSVLRKVPLPPRLGGLLEAESGFNDAPVVILVVALAGGRRRRPGGSCCCSSATSWCSGRRWAWRSATPARGGSDGSRCRRRASTRSPCWRCASRRTARRRWRTAAGFLAVYVAALVLGNVRLPHRSATRGFVEGAGLAGPDRAVRHAGPARDAVRARARRSCRRSASGWCCSSSPGRCRCCASLLPFQLRRGVVALPDDPGRTAAAVLGRSARCGARRAGDGARRPATSSTWSSSSSWSSRWSRRRPCRGWRSGSA